jgi:hypothetical protein
VQYRYANWQVLFGLSSKYKPQRVLEVGVMSGGGISAVLDGHAPSALVLCDYWSPEYKGSNYRSHDHIDTLLLGKSFAGTAQYLDGNSHVLLKQYRADNPTSEFDLIHVDGDHSYSGALADIRDCWPMLRQGGCMVVDDIIHAPSVVDAVNTFIHSVEHCYTELISTKPDGVVVLSKGRAN